MKYKLGLDLGSTSLGWAIVELDDQNEITRLVDMGVRIFPDGRDAQTHAPINVERRNARQMRRRTDRIKLRKKRTLQLIHKYGLDFDVRSDLGLENPYALRVKALSEKLTKPELGRVLFHFAQRRGFKSNRKETRGEAGGKLKLATETLNTAIADKTLGCFQYETGKYRFSDQFDGVKIKDGALYPTREMYLTEFKKICDAQNMPNTMRQEFENAIFYQRDLLPQEVGTCVFEHTEKRAFKYEPLYQKWRVLQQINQLKILDSGNLLELSKDQRDKLCEVMLDTFDGVTKEKSGRAKITFAQIRRILGLGRSIKFNLESEKRKDLDVESTKFSFFDAGLLDFWNKCNDDEKSEILNKLSDPKIEDDELEDFISQKYDLDETNAKRLIQIPLEDDVANVSLVVISKMLPYLEQGKLYHEAVSLAGYKHSEENIELMEALPYYGDLDVLKPSLVQDRNGRYRTMNATVHIAMNQIRAVINELIKEYGQPYSVNIEMGRDIKAGAKERSEIDSQQTKNKKENDRISKELQNIGIRANRENIQKYKLWETLSSNPLDRRCVYTGEIISIEKLYSSQFEIEHILPFSRTLDDSIANKTISRQDANKYKGNQAPYDAFNRPESPWNYQGIFERAQNLPLATKWRFNKGALDLYLKDQNCIDRALNDTRFITKMAVAYLKHVCPNKYNVAGVNGKMTSMFRNMWHLDWWKNKESKDKYRSSHIHHAIDAFVIACISPQSYYALKENAENSEMCSGKSFKEKQKMWFDNMSVPFTGFDYYDFMNKCENTLISYRKNIKNPKQQGTVGCLHEDTAYYLESFEKDTTAKMSHREALPQTDKEISEFKKKFKNVNSGTYETFLNETGTKKDDEEIVIKFLTWCKSKGIKKIRMIKSGVDTTTYVPVFRTKFDRKQYCRAYENWFVEDGISAGISDKKEKKLQQEKENILLGQYRNAAEKAYKWYVGGNNFCAEIFEIRKDDKKYPKKAGKWAIDVVSNYNAELNVNTPKWRKKYATAKRLMSLRINDMVMAEFSSNDAKLPKGIEEVVKYQCAIENKETVQVLFRVKKISSSGTVYLRPHFVAKEEADTKSWGASVSSLQEHKAMKIRVTPTGKILKQL